MLTKLRTLASLYRELGPRWLAFRLAYAFRLRTGLIRLQFPQYKWDDRPLGTWLKKDIPSAPEAYSRWRKNNSPKFFFDEHVGAGSPRPLSWNPQVAIDEANRLLNGEIKYFAHQYHQTGIPPNWHKDYVTLSEAKGLYHSSVRDSSLVALAQSDIVLILSNRTSAARATFHPVEEYISKCEPERAEEK